VVPCTGKALHDLDKKYFGRSVRAKALLQSHFPSHYQSRSNSNFIKPGSGYTENYSSCCMFNSIAMAYFSCCCMEFELIIYVTIGILVVLDH